MWATNALQTADFVQMYEEKLRTGTETMHFAKGETDSWSRVWLLHYFEGLVREWRLSSQYPWRASHCGCNDQEGRWKR